MGKLILIKPRAVQTDEIITQVPIVATLGGLIVLAIVITWWKRKKRIASSLWSRQSTRTAQSDGGVRVPLTADELAGTINNSSPAPAPRSRRTRRQRRTPSQQSTHSLPAYAKEPGEQELVVAQWVPFIVMIESCAHYNFYRGLPEEDENISQPLAIVVNADEDIGSSTETDSQTPSIPLQNAPAQIVLLVEGDTACDLSVRSGATGRNLRPASPDVDSTSSASIFQVDSHTSHNSPDPRGEAPGYFVMGQATVNRAFTAPESPDTSAALVTVGSGSRPASPLLSSSRRSGFRALLGRTAASRSHRAYPGSSGSGISLTIASPESPSHMHNRGASTTSLVSILGLSRQRSSASHNSSRPNLVSPSMISLNSISAPLTHTAVRTEFAAYPRQGLTPEQLQLISSREGLAKFGRPYGPDAVAFTSLSVIDLVTGQKPPDFEAAVGETRGSGVPSAGATGEPSEGIADEPQPIPESVVRPDQEHFPADLSQSRSPDISSTEQDTNATPAGTENTAIHDVPDEEKSAKILVAVHKGKAKEIPAQENNDSPEENKDHCYIKHFVPEASSETKQVPTSEIRSDLEAMFSSIEASTAPDIALLLPSFSARQTSATDFSNSSSSIQSASFNTTSRTNSLQLVDHGQPKSGQSARSSLMPARSKSHASLLSNTSITSRGTFQTATESMRSRKMTKWMGTTDDEHEDDLGEFSYDTADDGNTTEGDDDSRPSTPVPSQQNRELGGGSELAGVASSTQLTPLAKKQVSIVTITHG